MGTNYYLVRSKPSVDGAVHIGKSSAGWLFNFQRQDTWMGNLHVKWNSFDDVKAFLKEHTVDSHDYVILDEYDEVVSYDDLIDLVESKQNDPWCRSNKDNFSYADNVGGYRFTGEEFL